MIGDVKMIAGNNVLKKTSIHNVSNDGKHAQLIEI
jgi:hypothetical protein